MRKALLAGAACVCAILATANMPLGFIVFDARKAQRNRLPDGWEVHALRGKPDIAVISEPPVPALRLKSQNSSFSLERSVDVDLEKFPCLTWQWKVTELPRGGDLRRFRTDDQAAQVMLAFSDRRILSYVWDSTAPKDLVHNASPVPLLRLTAIVCRSGPSELNQWLIETRNVVADYQLAYGRPPSRVRGVRLQINSQHTGTSAESYFGDMVFHAGPQ